jgi:hypothetical protein
MDIVPEGLGRSGESPVDHRFHAQLFDLELHELATMASP